MTNEGTTVREFRIEPVSSKKPLMARLLTLEPVDEDSFRRTARASAPRRMFGGEAVAQAIVAAGLALPHSRPINAAHGHFIRAGDVTQPVDYRVERLHDGRSFSNRHVRAFQSEMPIFLLDVSAQESEPGLVHQLSPSEAPGPEALPSPEEYFANDPANLAWIRSLLSRNPIDCRFVDRPPRANGVHGIPSEAHQRVWVRITDALPDSDILDRAALGYISDLFLLATGVAPHGRTIQDADLQFASLDHSIWFHTRPPMHDWLLYDQIGLWSGEGRALCRGTFYDRHGTAVATVMQQALIRVMP